MSIAIRKEQVLAGLTVLVAAMVVPKYLAEPPVGKAWKPTIEAYQPEEPRSLALADAKVPPAARRDPCVEPSETNRCRRDRSASRRASRCRWSACRSIRIDVARRGRCWRSTASRCAT